MLFTVTNKATGQEVYRYAADAPIEWIGMEFTTHDHTAEIPADTPIETTYSRVWTRLEFLRRFTEDEQLAIRTAAKTVVRIENFLAMLDIAEEVRSDYPDLVKALNLFEAAGLIAEGRAQEILHGQ